MSGRFFDSSAIAKLYHPELGSGVIEQIVLDPAASILISRLSVVEIQSSRAKSGPARFQQAMRQIFDGRSNRPAPTIFSIT